MRLCLSAAGCREARVSCGNPRAARPAAMAEDGCPAGGGRQAGGRRRTSSSSRPSASISASTPYSAARSGSGPVSTVSPPLARACRAGNAQRIVGPRRPRTRIQYRCGGGSWCAPVTSSPPAGVTRRLAAAPSSGPAWEPFLMWRILSASLGAGRVSGHRMIGVIPDRDQRPGQQDMSMPWARSGARRPGTAHGPSPSSAPGSDGSCDGTSPPAA